jgi:hypothetical protein
MIRTADLMRSVKVPIDVQSVWPTDSLHIEDGLKRLGSWDEDHMNVGSDDLVKGNANIAHVALVYSKIRRRLTFGWGTRDGWCHDNNLSRVLEPCNRFVRYDVCGYYPA